MKTTMEELAPYMRGWCLWEQCDDEQERIVVETLARLLVKATRDKNQEQTND